jgi:flagellar hook-basal body complex protein FliE
VKINTEASALLAQIRDYQTQISDSRTARSEEKVLSGISEKTSFGSQISELVSESLASVSETQSNASALSNAYLAGEDIPLTEVVLEMQKSSLAFETTLQVRNKVLQAYEQIMNMPV